MLVALVHGEFFDTVVMLLFKKLLFCSGSRVSEYAWQLAVQQYSRAVAVAVPFGL